MVMRLKETVKFQRYLAMVIFIVFILDTVFHFIIVPIASLEFSWINLKGDIDFTNMGFVNITLRLIIYGFLAFQPHRLRKWLPFTFLIVVLPTLYLMIDSWWVFENYVLLYGYWTLILISMGVVTWLIQTKRISTTSLKYVAVVNVLLSFFIVLVYVEIMGWEWPREFVYAFFQRVLYEPMFIVLVALTALVMKEEKSS
jgi:hypothetical protein